MASESSQQMRVTLLGDSIGKEVFQRYESLANKKYIIDGSRCRRGLSLNSMFSVLVNEPITKSHIIIVQVGTNSIRENNATQCFELFSKRLLPIIKCQGEGAKIIVMSLAPKPLMNGKYNSTISKYNALLKSQSKPNHYQFYNYYTSLLKRPHMFIDDGMHLTSDGYSFLLQHFLQSLSLV